MIRHQSAAFADGSPCGGMVWIAGYFYSLAVFNVQQSAASWMAKSAITPAHLNHFYLLFPSKMFKSAKAYDKIDSKSILNRLLVENFVHVFE